MASQAALYKNVEKRTYQLSVEKRAEYREIALKSRQAKLAAEKGLLTKVHEINTPVFDPNQLMPQQERNQLSVLSLFSGGGGLDLGFDRAGFEHVASYELIPICKATFLHNRPDWQIFAGPEEGDVTTIDWTPYQGQINVVHGGPPCQPFSVAGEQKGIDDERNMWDEFNRAINIIQPQAFVAENVLGLLNPKFAGFVQRFIIEQLPDYHIVRFLVNSADYGIPQTRKRVIFVGFRDRNKLKKFSSPTPTHTWQHLGATEKPFSPSLFTHTLPKTVGVRAALGLPSIGYDNLAPTIRSAFTGKRNTTSILSSAGAQKAWGALEIWPNGVQSNREKASAFPAKNEHFRLSVQDVALLQGFPEDWHFAGAVYQILGQIGNAVAPPVAYQIALSVSKTLRTCRTYSKL